MKHLLRSLTALTISFCIAIVISAELFAQQCPEEVFFYDTVDSAGPISIANNLLALGGALTGFHILDISTPENPQLLSNIRTFGVEPCPTLVPAIPDVCIAGDILFVTYICPIYRADFSGFKVYNISDPSKPVMVGGYDTTVGDSMGFFSIQIYGHYLYAALGRWGVAAFDISNPKAPSKIWHDTEAGNIKNIDLTIPLMAAINYQGYDDTIIFYSLEDPGDPLFVKSLAISGDIKDLYFIDSRLYLIVSTGTGNSSLQIFDIADLSNIILLAKYDINGMTATHFALERGIIGISATDYSAPYPYKTYLLLLNAMDAHNIFLISTTEMINFYPADSGSMTYGDAQYFKRYLFITGTAGMKVFDAKQCIAGHDRPLSKPINARGIQ